MHENDYSRMVVLVIKRKNIINNKKEYTGLFYKSANGCWWIYFIFSHFAVYGWLLFCHQWHEIF